MSSDMKPVSPNDDTLHKTDHGALAGRPSRQRWQRNPKQVASFAATGIILFIILVTLVMNRPERCGKWYSFGVTHVSLHLGRLICHVSLSHLPYFNEPGLFFTETIV